MMTSDEEEMSRVVAFGGGVGAIPEVRQVTIRHPEVIPVGGDSDSDRWLVYIPKLPEPALLTQDQSLEDDLQRISERGMSGAAQYVANKYITRHWITTSTDLDTRDPLRPKVTVFGYERIYVFRIWSKHTEKNEREGGEA